MTWGFNDKEIQWHRDPVTRGSANTFPRCVPCLYRGMLLFQWKETGRVCSATCFWQERILPMAIPRPHRPLSMHNPTRFDETWCALYRKQDISHETALFIELHYSKQTMIPFFFRKWEQLSPVIVDNYCFYHHLVFFCFEGVAVSLLFLLSFFFLDHSHHLSAWSILAIFDSHEKCPSLSWSVLIHLVGWWAFISRLCLYLLLRLLQPVPREIFQAQLRLLTNRDCEVNAPTQNAGLLQGADLLNALDIDVLDTSH